MWGLRSKCRADDGEFEHMSRHSNFACFTLPLCYRYVAIYSECLDNKLVRQNTANFASLVSLRDKMSDCRPSESAFAMHAQTSRNNRVRGVRYTYMYRLTRIQFRSCRQDDTRLGLLYCS